MQNCDLLDGVLAPPPPTAAAAALACILKSAATCEFSDFIMAHKIRTLLHRETQMNEQNANHTHTNGGKKIK